MQPTPPDLTRQPPRSPRERVCGIAHLPRMFDKARAAAADRLGEYIYPCPMDRQVLDFLGLEADALRAAASKLSDDEMAGWVEAHAVHRDEAEREAFSTRLLTAGPEDEEGRRHLAEAAAALGSAGEGVRSWAELLDRDEGR
jgi:hypothetical protein